MIATKNKKKPSTPNILDNVDFGPRSTSLTRTQTGITHTPAAMPTATVQAVANQRGKWTTTELMVSNTRPPAAMMINGTSAGQSTDGDGIAPVSTCANSAPTFTC